MGWFPGAGRVQRFARRVQGGFHDAAVVLVYHRVAEAASDPWKNAVTPRHLAEHLDVIQRVARPCSLEDLSGRMKDGRPLRGAVAVTFDDGYVDNLTVAKPILERAGIPATFFIATGRGGREREYWWDELERLLLGSHPLPPSLKLEIGSRVHRWRLSVPGAPSDPGQTSREDLCTALYRRLYPLEPKVQTALLDHVRAWAERPAEHRGAYRTMTDEEVAAVSVSPLIEIGAHTESHPALPHQPLEAQREEINRGKTHLERVTGRPITRFAYPYGAHATSTRALVRAAGFHAAFTIDAGTVWRRTDPFRIPRITVRNEDGDAFADRLRRLTIAA